MSTRTFVAVDLGATSGRVMLADVGPDDRVALWLAAQVVVRVLGQMRQAAGLHMHADVTG